LLKRLTTISDSHHVIRYGTDSNVGTARETLAICVWLALLCALLGTVDATWHGIFTEYCIGAVTWLVFLLLLARAPHEHRLPAIIVVLVATDYECFGSLLCGFYQYRLHNLPVFVPAGHGIFYLSARRLLDTSAIIRFRRPIIMAAILLSGLWVFHGLFIGPRADVEGAMWWVLLLYFLWRKENKLLYALTFGLTMCLEFYGTGIGAWHWATSFPGTSFPSANPPSACAAGYCVLDASAMRLVRLCRSRMPGLFGLAAYGQPRISGSVDP